MHYVAAVAALIVLFLSTRHSEAQIVLRRE